MTELPDRIGRFDIEQRLGQGAMGVVYLATDPVLGRRVAIKCIQVHPGLAESEVADLRQRFENEARSAANLSHPNLVTIFDAGADDHTLYIAMEYVQGEGLDDIVAADRAFTYKEVADLVLQLGGALDHAHRQGIVHRDIKPANIMITRDGQPKITDFGVARQAASTLTATGTIIGTPAYMSPEQITGHEITGAADQFSLAIVVYELLTGRKPFYGEGATTVLYKIVHEDPEPPHSVSTALPGALDAVILKALSKDPSNRYGNCSQFASELRAALGAAPPDESITLNVRPGTKAAAAAGVRSIDATDPDGETIAVAPSAPVPPPAASAAAQAPATIQPAADDAPPRSIPVPVIAGGAAAILVVALLGWWAFSGAGGDAPAGDPELPVTEAEADPQLEVPEAGMPEATPSGTAATVAGEPQNASAAAASAATGPVSLRIVTRPAGASVTVDGGLLEERSPVAFEFTPGRRHQLLLERADYASVAWAFSLSDLTAEQLRSGQLFFPMQELRVEEPVAPVAIDEEAEEPQEAPEPLDPVDPVRIRGNIEPPEILEQTRPPFPEWAADSGLPTYVILELVVDRAGRVRDSKVLNTVHPALAEAAMEAVRSWRLAPAMNDGQPVDVFFNVTVQFEESGGDGA